MAKGEVGTERLKKKPSHMDPVIDLEILITGNSQRVKNFDFAYF